MNHHCHDNSGTLGKELKALSKYIQVMFSIQTNPAQATNIDSCGLSWTGEDGRRPDCYYARQLWFIKGSIQIQQSEDPVCIKFSPSVHLLSFRLTLFIYLFIHFKQMELRQQMMHNAHLRQRQSQHPHSRCKSSNMS